MKLKCPGCGAPIPASNINIHNMIAVCPNCDNIIQFGTAFQRKSRKFKQPQQVTVYETGDGSAHFAFKWTWRTEPIFAFAIMMTILLLAFGILAASLFSGMLPYYLPYALLMGAYPAYYAVGLYFNHTHFVADDEKLTVYTSPLWFPRYGKKTVRMDSIAEVFTENTYNLGTPENSFYHVFVRTDDNKRHVLVAYVNYDHAHYIAQELQLHLMGMHNLAPEMVADARSERLAVDAVAALDDRLEKPRHASLG